MIDDGVFNQVETFIAGRVLTYLLNAYIDARIAAALLRFLKQDEHPDDDGEISARARNFMTAAEGLPGYPNNLVALAYTLERVNGLVDYLYAGLLAQYLTPRKQHLVMRFARQHSLMLEPVPSSYPPDIVYPLRQILSISGDILSGHLEDARRYGREHWPELTISPTDSARMMVLVQEHNIRSNIQTARALHSSPEIIPLKVQAIRAAAQAVRYPNILIRSAIMTQHAAARWDRLFVVGLKLLYQV